MLSQLTDANMTYIDTGSFEANYTYKKDGNIDEREIDAQTEEFSYNGNLISGITIDETTTPLDWDLNGNLTDGISNSMVWNWDNKVRSASLGGDGVSFKYSPSGAMVYRQETVDSVTTKRKYIVDPVGKVPTILMELDPDNSDAIEKTYVHAPGQTLAQYDGDSTAARYYYLHDRLGSVRQIIDVNAAVQNEYTYDPFGNFGDDFASETSENIENPYRFAGYVWDKVIQEYYCNARWYDPALARFTGYDPVTGKLKAPMTLHQYLYCLNDPVNYIDPTGRYYEDHGTGDTLNIIHDATELFGEGLSGPFEAFGRRTELGKYDFKYHPDWEGDTFQLHDVVMDTGDFGNYVAGYASYYNYGVGGEIGTRSYGHLYSLSQYRRLDDADSKYFISAGVLQAQADTGGASGLAGKLSFVFSKMDLYRGIERMCMMDPLGRSTSFTNSAGETKTSNYDKELKTFTQFWNNGRLAH